MIVHAAPSESWAEIAKQSGIRYLIVPFNLEELVSEIQYFTCRTHTAEFKGADIPFASPVLFEALIEHHNHQFIGGHGSFRRGQNGSHITKWGQMVLFFPVDLLDKVPFQFQDRIGAYEGRNLYRGIISTDLHMRSQIISLFKDMGRDTITAGFVQIQFLAPVPLEFAVGLWVHPSDEAKFEIQLNEETQTLLRGIARTHGEFLNFTQGDGMTSHRVKPVQEIVEKLNQGIQRAPGVSIHSLVSEKSIQDISAKFAKRYIDLVEAYRDTRNDRSLSEVFENAAREEKWEPKFIEIVARENGLLRNLRELRLSDRLGVDTVVPLIAARLRYISR